MKNLLLSAAVAAAFSVPTVVLADPILFDRSGSGGAGDLTDQWAWQAGQAVCDNCTTTNGGSGAGTLVVQAALAGMTLGGNNANTVGQTVGVSYQLSIPVSTTRTGVGAGAILRITPTGPGAVNMYADPTPSFIYASGCGFGALQSGCAANGDQVNILSGVASLGGSLRVTQLTAGSIGPLGPNTSALVDTAALFGSTTFNIDAITADPNYWRSDITSSIRDLNIVSASFLAPLAVDAASQVGTVTPNYGKGAVPVNSLTCVRDLIDSGIPCDQQYQVSANTQFKPPIPLGPIATEITSMNLSGTGLLPVGRDPAGPGALSKGYQYVQSLFQITESASNASTGQATILVPQRPVQNGEMLGVAGFFDVFFDVTITDVDPVNNFVGNVSQFAVPGIGPAHMELEFGPCIADTSKPNYGCLPPVGGAYIGHFDIAIPLGVDVNGNGNPDVVKFTVATHQVGGVTNTSITGTHVVDTFQSILDLNGSVNDELDDPPFHIVLFGPTTAQQEILIPAVPLPATAALLGIGLAGMGFVRRKRP